MGYYSKVSISIDKQTFQNDVFLQNISRDVFQRFKETVYDEYINFQVEAIKWYTSKDEVQIITTYLDKLDDHLYNFLRAGDDLSDTDNLGFLHDNRYLETIIKHSA